MNNQIMIKKQKIGQTKLEQIQVRKKEGDKKI